MAKFHFILLPVAFALASALAPNASAQDKTTEKSLQEPIVIDEIITQGQRQGSNHPGMNAFFDGDFTTAEIAFEREFLKLKRSRTAIENAAFEASNGQFRAESLAGASRTSSSSAGGRSSAQTNNSFTPNTTSGVTNKGKTGRGLLTDGKVTYDDFSFSKYMAGLSELQLGKYKEAEKSFKTALFYNSKNYDARLRIGLLNLKNEEYEKAAKQLEKLDKMRRKCIKTSCEDREFITNATVELATLITKTANNKQ